MGLASGPDQLLFCRAVIPRVLERRRARPSRCRGFPAHHSGRFHWLRARNFDPALGPAHVGKPMSWPCLQTRLRVATCEKKLRETTPPWSGEHNGYSGSRAGLRNISLLCLEARLQMDDVRDMEMEIDIHQSQYARQSRAPLRAAFSHRNDSSMPQKSTLKSKLLSLKHVNRASLQGSTGGSFHSAPPPFFFFALWLKVY